MRFVLRTLLLLTAACCCPLLPAQTPDRFAAYEHCKFADDLTLVETAPLPSGVLGRTVKTIMGPRQVPLAGATRLLFAYPQTEPFANVKVERIPAESYAQAKQDLIANFEQILTGDDSSTRNYTLKPRLNGLEIYGLDRKALEGGVLGIYLFFVDRTHTATTIFFLNQDPDARAFHDLNEYAGLRTTFLNAYTGCAAGPSRSRTVTAREAATAPPAPPVPLPEIPAATVAAGAAALPEAPMPTGSAVATPEAPTAPPAAEASPTPARPAARGSAHKAVATSARKTSKASVHKPRKASASKTAKRPASKKKKAASR